MRLLIIFAGLITWALSRESQSVPAEILPHWITPAKGRKFEHWFVDASRRYNIPAGLLSRVALQESNYNPFAESSAGALGLMQIIPKWHPNIRNPFDAKEAIYYAAGYLYELKNRFGSWKLALAAYNWGPTNLSKKGINRAPTETINYVTNITRDIPL